MKTETEKTPTGASDSTGSFSPQFYRRMLHGQVMVLAKTRIEGTWKAYCFPVPGKSHDNEEYLWEREGSAISEKLARQMFPSLENVPYSY